jgi:hypothetical protein
MGKFNVCVRVARAGGPRPSYAWVALHQCVEANARLTGEPFTSIFSRLQAAHRFGREPDRWPNACQIAAAAEQLQRERDAYLGELRAREEARRAEKRAGRRANHDRRLAELTRRAATHRVPQVGYGGWRRRRESPE